MDINRKATTRVKALRKPTKLESQRPLKQAAATQASTKQQTYLQYDFKTVYVSS